MKKMVLIIKVITMPDSSPKYTFLQQAHWNYEFVIKGHVLYTH